MGKGKLFTDKEIKILLTYIKGNMMNNILDSRNKNITQRFLEITNTMRENERDLPIRSHTDYYSKFRCLKTKYLNYKRRQAVCPSMEINPPQFYDEMSQIMGNCTFSQWDYKFTMSEHPLISPDDLLHAIKVEDGCSAGSLVKRELHLQTMGDSSGDHHPAGDVYRCYDDDVDYLRLEFSGVNPLAPPTAPPSGAASSPGVHSAPPSAQAQPTVASDLPSPTAATQATPPSALLARDTPPRRHRTPPLGPFAQNENPATFPAPFFNSYSRRNTSLADKKPKGNRLGDSERSRSLLTPCDLIGREVAPPAVKEPAVLSALHQLLNVDGRFNFADKLTNGNESQTPPSQIPSLQPTTNPEQATELYSIFARLQQSVQPNAEVERLLEILVSLQRRTADRYEEVLARLKRMESKQEEREFYFNATVHSLLQHMSANSSTPQ